MTQIITIANYKGGVGKTTTACEIAQLLTKAGYTVLIVDTDAQGQVAPLLGLPKADDLFRLLVAEEPLHNCIIHANSHQRLGVVRGHTKTAKAKDVLNAGPMPAPVNTLAGHLAPAIGVVDYIMIDTAPSLDSLGLATLWAADHVIIPTQCERLSLQGVVNVIAAIKTLRDTYGAKTRLLAILPTFYRISTIEHRRQLKRLHDAYGKDLVWPAIPEATSVAQASARAKPIFEHDPGSKVTHRYERTLELLINATT